MSLIAFSIPSSLAVAGAISISGTQVIATGGRLEVGTDVTNATLMVSDSGNLVLSAAQSGMNLLADIASLSGVMNAGFASFPKFVNSFTVAPPNYRYLWSGAALTSGIATLPTPSTASGIEYLIKNISTGALLVLSGLVDYRANYILYPSSCACLVSDSASWILI